jgi:hypothetical protein
LDGAILQKGDTTLIASSSMGCDNPVKALALAVAGFNQSTFMDDGYSLPQSRWWIW